jgi:trehalose 6-phosphate synthase
VRLSLRFIVPLLLVLAAFAYAVLPLVDGLTVRWFVRDLDIRATLIANTVRESIESSIQSADNARIVHALARITEDERVYAVAFCTSPDATPISAGMLPDAVRCAELAPMAGAPGHILDSPQGPLLMSVRQVGGDTAPLGDLALIHDMSFVTRRSEETRRYVFALFVGLGIIVSLLTVVIAQLSWRGWEQGMRALLRGEGLLRAANQPDVPEFRPLARDLRELIRDIESERRPNDEDRFTWSPESLRAVLHHELRDQEVIVVSNREPYIHMRKGETIEVRRPASGLVTALEPIMRTCSGTWIAHGSGSADREVVDRHDRIAVPPDHPGYQLRRVWLTE